MLRQIFSREDISELDVTASAVTVIPSPVFLTTFEHPDQ
jgi:hypothetical protein